MSSEMDIAGVLIIILAMIVVPVTFVSVANTERKFGLGGSKLIALIIGLVIDVSLLLPLLLGALGINP